MRMVGPAVAVAAVSLLAACTDTHHVAATSRSQAPVAVAAPAASGGFDVRAENAKPGTSAWGLPGQDWASDTQLAGWVDHSSIRPGTALKLHVTSTEHSYTATAYRLGWYGGKKGRQIWKSAALRGTVQPTCAVRANRMVDCSKWSVATTIPTTNWPEGLYLIKLLGADGKGKYVPLTVRSASTRGRLALVNADATYQAYNAYGGYSVYHGKQGFGDRAYTVSFDRPYDRSGARYVTAGEQEITGEAERLGLPLAYVTDTDISAYSHLLDGALGVVSPNHDEYWDTAMRDSYQAARNRGTNLAFLGANAEYWRVRFEAGNRHMTTYKSPSLDPVANDRTTTNLWRSAPYPRPEAALTGLMYECFPARAGFKVFDPSFFLFAGTGAKQGSTYPGVVGVEIDRAYPVNSKTQTPSNLQVVGHSPAQCANKGMTFSDFSYYTVPSGAGVVATGSMQWAVGINQTNGPTGITAASSAFVTTVTGNLLRAMSQGPMGKAHPAKGNLSVIKPSGNFGTGTGGIPTLDADDR
ncbi:N,N-dimethylformamidase beta subunit family domain-containing protein [Branchiibius sp. NY16-3462-2]|uniref:N,N-dimethylformamidase beta subunit family domain-containing protein n=1 Tax=Branchiibius sp. NY16-3462-2 TaxID=1807500 RepID=UPI0025C38C6C|nr:N,N-dimethylformamidase beta subunit family domain-containing protein [Branchiibius sp. NY16-3462-2]